MDILVRNHIFPARLPMYTPSTFIYAYSSWLLDSEFSTPNLCLQIWDTKLAHRKYLGDVE